MTVQHQDVNTVFVLNFILNTWLNVVELPIYSPNSLAMAVLTTLSIGADDLLSTAS